MDHRPARHPKTDFKYEYEVCRGRRRLAGLTNSHVSGIRTTQRAGRITAQLQTARPELSAQRQRASRCHSGQRPQRPTRHSGQRRQAARADRAQGGGAGDVRAQMRMRGRQVAACAGPAGVAAVREPQPRRGRARRAPRRPLSTRRTQAGRSPCRPACRRHTAAAEACRPSRAPPSRRRRPCWPRTR